MGVEGSDAAIHYPLALFCRKEHLFAGAGAVVFSCGIGLATRVHFAETQPADTPQARCRYRDYHPVNQ
jgi:hypothetical protein